MTGAELINQLTIEYYGTPTYWRQIISRDYEVTKDEQQRTAIIKGKAGFVREADKSKELTIESSKHWNALPITLFEN